MTTTHGALHGLRVIELAAIGPVPMAGMLLADHGAEVTRIDRLVPSGLGLNMAHEHDVHARHRRSLALDLKATEGRDALLHVLDNADVLLEGFRPGVLERLGLAPEALLARNPRLVVGRMTGYGQTGPLAQAAGHDLNYLALTGVLDAIGPAQGAPLPPLNLVADYGGGAMFLAFGVMAALFERQRSGLGQVVDAAMVDGVAAMAGIFQGLRAAGEWQAQRGSNLLDGGAPFYACYAAADGHWLAVAALEPKFFAALVKGVGLDPVWTQQQHDRQRWPALRAELTVMFQTRSRDDWCDLLAGTDACVSPVLSFAQAPLHAHAQARAAYTSVGEGVGAGQVAQPAAAPRLGRSAQRLPGPAPRPGSHTVAILQEAGLSASEIESLLAAGVAR